MTGRSTIGQFGAGLVDTHTWGSTSAFIPWTIIGLSSRSIACHTSAPQVLKTLRIRQAHD